LVLFSFLCAIFWHVRGVRILLLFVSTLALSGLLPCAGADSHVALLRILNSDPSEAKRLDALGQLEKNAPLEAAQILRSITDTSPAIRAAMVRLGTPLCGSDPELALRLLALANDRAPQVQRQMLLALPSLTHPNARTVYRKLLETARRSTSPELRTLAQGLPD
jgi:hypothetical protein